MASARKVIRLRITIPYAVVMAAVLTAVVWAGYWVERHELDRETRVGNERIHHLFVDFLEHESNMLGAHLRYLGGDARLAAAWRSGDYAALYRLSRPLYDGLHEDYAVTHFYFIAPDRRCALRVHAPKRRGDIIKRHTLERAATTKHEAHGIELGPMGTFTLRVVRPWVVGGELIGYLEIGKEIEHLTPHIKDLAGLELIFTVFKTHITKDQWRAGRTLSDKKSRWERFQRFVISDTSLKQLAPELDTLLRDDVLAHAGIVEFSSSGRNYAALAQPLRDARNVQVGQLIGLRDITERKATLAGGLFILTASASTVGLLLLGFLFVYAGRIGRRLDIYASSLEKMVKERTSELERALDEVKVLKGLLPICASCKKVRTDEGEWHSVERYVTERSEASFTHSVCPECKAALYPELED